MQATSLYPSQWCPSLLIHICITWPPGVNTLQLLVWDAMIRCFVPVYKNAFVPSYHLYKSHDLTMLYFFCKMENILHDHMYMDETEFHLHGVIGSTTNPGSIHYRNAICAITKYVIIYEPIYIFWIKYCQFHIRVVIGTDQKTFFKLIML